MKFLPVALFSVLLAPLDEHGVGGAGAAAASFIDARESATNIERKFVGDGSAKSYTDQLVRFITYLFDNHKAYLADDHLEQMESKHEADERDRLGRRRARGRGHARSTTTRSNLRGYTKTATFRLDQSR